MASFLWWRPNGLALARDGTLSVRARTYAVVTVDGFGRPSIAMGVAQCAVGLIEPSDRLDWSS